MIDGARPQDVDRPHRRRGAPSTETVTLLARYQEAMRSELRAVLVELEGKPPAPGLVDVGPLEPVRPALSERTRLWDLAIKIGRELGSAVDADPVPIKTEPKGRGRRRRADFG